MLVRVARDPLGHKIIKIGLYTAERVNGKVALYTTGCYSSYRVFYGNWWKTPEFPNFMQAVRFAKEHYNELF